MKKITMIAGSVVGLSLITFASMGIASATSATGKGTATIGKSGISRSVFRTERLDASATVLGTTTDAVTAAHKAHTMDQLIAKAGLTRKTYDEKLKAQLTTDLEAKGYSQDQITIALQHRHIGRLEHRKNHRN